MAQCTRVATCIARIIRLVPLAIIPGLAEMAPSHAQGQVVRDSASLPRLELHRRLRLGVRDMNFHRVTSAAVLRGGQFAVADAGNFRVLVFDELGTLIRQLGRRGRGPGEFEDIAALFAFGDTILAYDPFLARLSLWSAQGNLLRSVALPAYDDLRTDVYAAESAGRLLLGTLEIEARTGPDRIVTKRTTLLLFDVADAHLRVLGRHDTEREFFRNHGDGFSSLRAPFFGRALFAAFPGRYSVIPLDSAVMHLRYSGEDRTGTIQLPIAPRPFPRSAVEAYADSVTAAWGRDPQLRRAAEDAREVYSSLETPALAPFARRLLRMGTEAWVEVFPLPPVRTVEWLVIDVESRVVKAHLSVPTSVTVLGGDVQSVIALVRSALDEEFVEVYDVRR